MAAGAKGGIPNVLTIAGVDPSGGAGVLADVKAMSACGCYACGVVTALTAQNTRGVFGVAAVEPDFVRAQLDAVFDDVPITAVKIGMLADARLVETVAEVLAARRPRWIVLDPVMVAKSNDRLLEAEAVGALRERLLPLASVATPNLPEAADLLGVSEAEVAADVEGAALRLLDMMEDGAWVLLKGGHLAGAESTDLLASRTEVHRYSAPRIETVNTHGTGCTLSSALAAYLARTQSMPEAVRLAKDYVTGAIRSSGLLDAGGGHGPTHHFWRQTTN